MGRLRASTSGPVPSAPSVSFVEIDNSSGSIQTDYAVRISITAKLGMLSDFSNVRFVDSDGSTELSYWRESFVDSTSAIFWVKIPLLPASVKTIYAIGGGFYGGSNGFNVFPFFDDFSSLQIDGSRWTTVGTSSEVAVVRDFGTETLFRAGNGGQGLAKIGNTYYFGKNNGTGVDGSVCVVNSSGTVTATYTAPPHAAMISVRNDNGNILVSSGSTNAAVVWEIDPSTGTKLNEWNFSSVGYGAGAGVAYHSAGKFLLFTSEAVSPYNWSLHLVAAGAAGSFVVEKVWSYSGPTMNLPQGAKWKDGNFWFLTSQTSGFTRLRQIRLNDDGSVTQLMVWDNLNGNEGQGLEFDSAAGAWIYGASNLDIIKINFGEERGARLIATPQNNKNIYIRSNSLFSRPSTIGVRCKIGGKFPSIGFSDEGGTAVNIPGEANNAVLLGQFSTVDYNPRGRQRSAASQTQNTYAGASNVRLFQNYEIDYDATVRYRQNTSTLGTSATNVPSGSLYAVLGGITAGATTTFELAVSWVYVRKTQVIEPTVSVT